MVNRSDTATAPSSATPSPMSALERGPGPAPKPVGGDPRGVPYPNGRVRKRPSPRQPATSVAVESVGASRATPEPLSDDGRQQYLNQLTEFQTITERARANAEQRDDAKGVERENETLAALGAARADAMRDRGQSTAEQFWSLEQTIDLGCRRDPGWKDSEKAPHARSRIVERIAKYLLLQLRNGVVEAYSNERALPATAWSNREIAIGRDRCWGIWTERAPQTGVGEFPDVRIERTSVLDLFSVPRPSDEEVKACVLEIVGSHDHPPLTRAELRDRVERRLPGTTEASWRHIYSQLPPELKRSRGDTPRTLAKKKPPRDNVTT